MPHKHTRTHTRQRKRKIAHLERPKRRSLSTRGGSRATRVTPLLPGHLCERLRKSNANSFSSVSVEALRPEQRQSRCLQRSNGCRRGGGDRAGGQNNKCASEMKTHVGIHNLRGEKNQTETKKTPKKHILFVFLPLRAVSWLFRLLLFPPQAPDVAPRGKWGERRMSQPACCRKTRRGSRWHGNGYQKHPGDPAVYFLSLFFFYIFPFLPRSLLFSTMETELGPIWFGFSMNYHGLDPVSAVKAPKMSQLYPYPPYEYSTTCYRLPIVFSFVLVSDSTGDSVHEGKTWRKGEVALIYDPIAGTGATATHLDGLKGGASSPTWLNFIRDLSGFDL